MKRQVHPDKQTAFNVLLQLGMPERDAKAIARAQTTPAIIGFLAVVVGRLAATLPAEQNPVDELRRVLRAAAPTRTADHAFFFPVAWPATFFGGPLDGRRGSVGLMQPRFPYLDRDGNLHVYEGHWWKGIHAWSGRAFLPRTPIEMRFAGTTRPPLDDLYGDVDDDWLEA